MSAGVGDIADHTIAQDWAAYSDEEHATWRTLFAR